MGVGYIGAVQGGSRGTGDEESGDDDSNENKQRNQSIFCGHWQFERYLEIQQGRDRFDVCDSAREGYWGCSFHGDDAVRTDRMQGDRVGVRDIDAVQGGAWGSGHAASGDDDRGAVGQWDSSILFGFYQNVRDEGIQQGRDSVGISDGARG